MNRLDRLRQSLTGAAIIIAATLPTFAAAEPAHYVVFEFDISGAPQPVFYAQVDLALSPKSAAKDALIASPQDERVVFHSWRDGVDMGQDSVDVPRFIRGEFAHDPDHGNGSIDSVLVEPAQRSFVLRLPLKEADAVDFIHLGKTQHIDLNELAVRADRLAFAASVPKLKLQQAPNAGSPANRADVLVLSEGYTAAQEALFNTNAAALHTAFFGLTPYKEYESFVNWTTGFVASVQSGADHPPYLAGCTVTTCCADAGANGDPFSGRQVNTAFDARFCTSQIQRLVTVSSSKVFAAAATFPNWDKIVVVVNDSVYGGSGGNISVTSTNGQANQIVLHEYGHSFTGLGDEYTTPYPGFPACNDVSGGPLCEPNVTNQTSAAQVKWASWFAPSNPIPTPAGNAGVGLFEGARYLTSGMYRPTDTQCLMHFNNRPFCALCRQEYVRKLYRGGFGVPAAGIDLIEPGSEVPSAATPVAYGVGSNRTFQATLLAPTIGSLDKQWYLDGNPIGGATGDSYVFNQATQTPATRTLELRVTDLTAFVSPAMAGSLLIHSRTWIIQVTDLIFANGFE